MQSSTIWLSRNTNSLIKLPDKAIKDQLGRILVIFGACAGLCFTALWYFPVLITTGGVATVVWDLWLRQKIGKLRVQRARKRNSADEERIVQNSNDRSVTLE